MKRKKLISIICCCLSMALAGCATGVNIGGNETEKPDIETPDTETPDIETPDPETPDTETPDTETPVANKIELISYKGLQESISCEWKKVNSASSYKVYFKETKSAEYTLLETELIRNYGSYYRADIIGLKAGSYDVTVYPVIDGLEQDDKKAMFTTTTIAHVREGFAWVSGTSSGAYNEDGTLKANALVLYVNNNTKDTITASIKTSSTATTSATGLQNILNLIKKGAETRPVNIRLIGQITDFAVMEAGDMVLDGNSKYTAGITIEGIGKDATCDGWGIRLKNISNVEIRNLGFMNCDSGEGDNVSLQQGNDHVWVHNCDMFYGDAGSDSDQAKGDGALDSKKSTYITFSYNHFYDSGKCNLVGLSEGSTDGYFITFHHNWYDHSDSRHPRVRYYTTHVYNNYYDGNSKYGIGSTMGSSILSEGNYFRNCKFPMLISMQGSDVYNASTGTNDYKDLPTFSKENGGIIKSYNDYMEGQERFVSYQENNVDFDAYVASTRDEMVPNTVTASKGGSTYNNFDTSSTMYSYNASSPEEAKANVTTFAGRMEGGDFSFTFTEEDDTSYAVNEALKQALKSYKSQLVLGSDIAIEDLIDEITALPEEVTIADIAQIKDCYAKYASLQEDEKNLVSNGIKLKTLYQEALKIEVDVVIDLINGLKTSPTSAKIKEAQAAYSALTEEQKALVTNYSILEEISASVPQEDVEHNFTTSGNDSDFFTIEGNLSTSKGEVIYEGMTLTQCLKLEGSTKISFTVKEEMALTLVFKESQATIKIDGVSYTADQSGVLTVKVSAGTHTISKKNTANLFYISLK